MDKKASDYAVVVKDHGDKQTTHRGTSVEVDDTGTYVEFGDILIEGHPRRGEPAPVRPLVIHSDDLVTHNQLFATDASGNIIELRVI